MAQFNINKANDRIGWIDTLKGIAIMFVVLGHNPITSTHAKMYNVIFSFHIPLFFFISGYLFNPHIDFHDLMRRRFNSIVKPYLFTIAAVSLLYVTFKSGPFFLWYLFWALFGNGPNLPKLALHLWFLPSLFVTIIFAWFAFKHIDSLKKSRIVQILFICGLFACGILFIQLFWELKIPRAVTDFFITDGHLFFINGMLDNPAYSKEQLLKDNHFLLNGLPFSLDIIFLTTAFFISGYVVKHNKFEKFIHGNIFGIISLLAFCTLHLFFNDTIDLNLRRYDHAVISTLMAYTAILASMYIAQMIGASNNRFSKAVRYIGKYSLIIFIFHPIFENKFYAAFISVLPGTTYIAAISAFIAGIFLPLAINFLFLERLKFFRFWYYAK